MNYRRLAIIIFGIVSAIYGAVFAFVIAVAPFMEDENHDLDYYDMEA